MNKSKFLKKSLAAVLAVLMIVAMIPLSAAAYDAEVTEISIGTARATGGPTNWNITIPAPTTGTEVKVALGNHGGVVRHYDDSNPPVNTADNTTYGGNVWAIPMTATEVNDGKSGKVEFDIFDSVGATDTIQHITLNWTLAEGSNDVSVKTIVAKKNGTVVQYGDTQIDPDASNTYLITLPYNAIGDGTTTDANNTQWIYVTPNSASATVRYGTSGTPATEVGDGSFSFPITITNRESETRFDVVNGTSIKNYVVKTTNASAFAEFSVAGERKAAKIDNVNHKVIVYMPYGTKTDANAKLNIIPTFKKGYEEITYKLTKLADNSKVDFESGKQIDANVYFATSALAASTALPVCDDENEDNTDTSLKTMPVEVTYSDKDTENWTIEFQAPTKDPQPTLKGLKIGNFAADINETNHTAVLKLPSSLRVANSTVLQGLASPNAKVLVVDTNAVAQTIAVDTNITPQTTGKWRNLACNDDDDNADAPIDLKNKDWYWIRVTAAGDAKGGSTGDKAIQDYRLTIETVETVGTPAITEMILEKNDEAKTQYKATITDTTILFNLPFSVFEAGELDDWKLYYSLSNGSHLTSGITDPSGLILDGTETYLPSTFDGKVDGSATTIDVENELGKTSYKIAIKQADPNNSSTMTGFKVTTADKFENIKDGENTFAATVSGRDLTVEVPYSIFESMKTADTLDTFNIVANLPEGARVYYVTPAHSTGAGAVYPDDHFLDDVPDIASTTSGTANGLNVMSKDGDEDDPAHALLKVNTPTWGYDGEIKTSTGEARKLMLVVVSQKAGTSAADGTSKITYATTLDSLTTGEFTTYTLTIKKAKPSQLARLDSFSVYDDATNTRISATVDNTGNKINLTLPASFVGAANLSPGGVTRDLYFDYATSHYEKITPLNARTPSYVATTSTALHKLTLESNGDVDTTKDHSEVAQATNTNGKGALYLDTTNAVDVLNFVRVESEAFVLNKDNGQARDYELVVKYEEPRKQAALTSVTINGVSGSPDANGKVSITLPKGTDLTGLKPTFNISNYGYMTNNGAVAAADGSNLLNSGALMNFTGARKVYVFCEDGSVKRDYTIEVKTADEFLDVKPSDWFYSYVINL